LLSTHGRDLRFLLVFALIISLYYSATFIPQVNERFFPWYLALNARVSVVLLNGMGWEDVTAEGKAIRSPGGSSIQIEKGCDAVEPSALFVAAVLASPVVLRRKIPAVLLGTALLLVLNLVRIVTLYLTARYARSIFDTMHLDVWQAAFIVLAIFFWAVWASWVRRAPPRQPHATG
jgi:exosortase/archaeosortase family protein